MPSKVIFTVSNTYVHPGQDLVMSGMSLDAEADERGSTPKTQLDTGPARDAVDSSTGSMSPSLLSCSAPGVLELDASTGVKRMAAVEAGRRFSHRYLAD